MTDQPVPFQPRLSSICRVSTLVACALMCAGFTAGCSSPQTMRVAKLPAHFIARPTANARTVDLLPLANNTISEDTLVAGDVIEVAITAGLDSDDSVELTARIGDDGTASFPQIGSVRLAGLELESAESAIAQTSIKQGVYRKPQITVTMKQPKTVRVTVAGAVDSPGTYELRPGSSDLLHALVVAGSLTEEAGVNVEIRQPNQATVNGTRAPLVADAESDADGTQLVGYNPTIPVTPAGSSEMIKVDLASLSRGSSDRYRLRDGAVVYVEQRDPAPLSIGGLVNNPDRYEYPVGENIRLLDAINIAGGESNIAADKVYVIREVESGGRRQRGVIQVSINDAKHDDRENMLLKPGDVVTVEKTAGTIFLETIRTVGFNLSGRAF